MPTEKDVTHVTRDAHEARETDEAHEARKSHKSHQYEEACVPYQSVRTNIGHRSHCCHFPDSSEHGHLANCTNLAGSDCCAGIHSLVPKQLAEALDRKEEDS